MRDRMHAELPKLARECADDVRRSIDATCQEAMTETTANVGRMVEEKLGHLPGLRFDYDSDARTRMENDLSAWAPVIAAALWNDWALWIDGMYEIIDADYLGPVILDSQAQQFALQDLLYAYLSLESAGSQLAEEILQA
jgi:hypothetical protein